MDTPGGTEIEGNVYTQGGDFVGRDKITYITKGIDRLPTRYDGRVQNFLHYYLGTPEDPAPFGGRQADLQALDAWLDDPKTPRYSLMAAQAGRGKSALLTQWVIRLTNSQRPIHVVYFPI